MTQAIGHSARREQLVSRKDAKVAKRINNWMREALNPSTEPHSKLRGIKSQGLTNLGEA